MTRNTQHSNTNRNDNRTSPRGMAPDSGHTARGVSVGRRETEVAEQFDNSRQNAQSRQTERTK